MVGVRTGELRGLVLFDDAPAPAHHPPPDKKDQRRTCWQVQRLRQCHDPTSIA
jgi:hypothetical protein